MDNGGPAFPRNGQLGSYKTDVHPYERISDVREFNDGMSLRDWFAGMCMTGFSATQDFMHTKPEDCATMAYLHADALLAERAKEKP